MPSHLQEIQKRMAALEERAKVMSPMPKECDEVLAEIDELGDLATQELELVLDLADRTGALAQNVQKVLRLAMLVALPMFVVLIVGAVLSVSALTLMNEIWPFTLFSLVGLCNAGLIWFSDQRVRAKCADKQNVEQAQADVNEESVVQIYADMLDKNFALVETYARKFDGAAQRRQMCDKPWQAAAAVLALECAVCTACGRTLFFLKALLHVLFGLLISGGASVAIDAGEHGAHLGLVGLSTCGPADANVLERAALISSRSPLLFSLQAAALALVGFPMVNAHVITSQALASMASKRQSQARKVVADVRQAKRSVVARLRTATRPAASIQSVATESLGAFQQAVNSEDAQQTGRQAAAAIQALVQSEEAQQVASSAVQGLMGFLSQGRR
eukprot:TRINITY_DN8193_c0_g1_i1.p1 TRINITY_DN8193_c0_g1~~TRINITY_DN8193_c0_g1_i1.p1  ORF type:complete len:389 (+),score=79.56 TRINITY_DN8193_c0_g1_i1:49-1215(+)